MTERLNKAIINLYDTFSRYQGNFNMQGSAMYGDLKEWNKDLFEKPLNKLTRNDLVRFAGKAITTWGNNDDFKHFLPRLLELMSFLDPPLDIWILVGKLELADWDKWDKEEQDVTKEILLATWDNLLNDDSEKAEWEFPNYFATLSHFYPNFTELTDIWITKDSFSSIKHLTNYVYEENQYLFLKGFIRGNEKSIRNIDLFKKWLFSDKLLQNLTKASYQFEQTDLAEKISLVLKILEDENANKNLLFHS